MYGSGKPVAPTLKDVTSWTSGGNTADAKVYPRVPFDPEPYFIFQGNTPFGQTLKGFGPRNDARPNGTIVTTSGSGSSVINTDSDGKKIPGASFRVTAVGVLGPDATKDRDYHAEAAAKDPWA